jgi:Protein of unknown function (DUF1761)
MHGFDVNWLAVLVAALVKFAIGGVWYSPPVFGPRWGAIVGVSPEAFKARMMPAMITDLAASLVLAWILANVLKFTGAGGLVPGIRVSFFLWLGFVATPLLSTTVYEGRPLALFRINAGYWLIAMLIMGGIIGAW